jgi:carboxypeptidase Taq
MPLALQGTFPVRQQHKLNRIIAEHIGFDFCRGRMVDNDNYMTDGGRDDCYITTAYDKNNIHDGFIMHEAGHGLYVQGLPEEFDMQPVGNFLGLAVHEMTAMIIECHAAATPGFFRFLSMNIQDVFNRYADRAVMPENLRALNARTQPSFVRMLADELTYPLHLTLRYPLERDGIAGKIDISRDLPDAWNEGFKARFGMTPPDPKQGCMQDQHWPTGSIGYFPDYLLGRMGAAQLFAAATKAHPSIAKGDMPTLKSWMTEHVYSKGSLLTQDQLFLQATGETLNAQPLFSHLSQKFLGKPYAS